MVSDTRATRDDVSDSRAFRLPAILLGVGLGGFVDGIVLHQLLQWHHMLSARYPADSLANLQLNTLADGLFHAGTWLVTLVAVLLAWRAAIAVRARPPGRVLAGGFLAGWGGFNLVEGLVDHHILAIHHVRPGPDQVLYDVGFLVWGATMLVAGAYLMRKRPETA